MILENNAPVTNDIDGTFIDLRDHMALLIATAEGLANDTKHVRDLILGTSPDTGKVYPKEVVNGSGHISALSDLMNGLSSELDIIGEHIHTIMNKL